MPGSQNSASLQAQYLAPWTAYRTGINANDSLGAIGSVAAILDLTHALSAASTQIWVTPRRVSGTGTITLTLVRMNEGSLGDVTPYQVVTQETGVDHLVEKRFANLAAGRFKILVTAMTGGAVWDLHTTYISSLAFAGGAGSGGGGTPIEVPTAPYQTTPAIDADALQLGAGWIIDGNVAPFSGVTFSNITYTGATFYLLSFQNFAALGQLETTATTGQDLTVTNVTGIADLSTFATLTDLGLLTVTNNPGLADVSGFANVTTIQTCTFDQNPDLLDISGFAALTTVNTLVITGNSGLADITGFGALTTADGITITGNSSLTDVSGFGAFSAVGLVEIKNNPALATLSGITALPTTGSFNFSNNAFAEAEVDRLLAVAVASNFVGEIWLNGAGNAAPSSTGSADVATLVGNGATVHVNAAINLQARGSLGIGSGNVFGSDRSVANGNVCFFTNGYTVYAVDTTDPDNPFEISSIGYNSGGGGSPYTGPNTITMSGFADTNANGVYTLISANAAANVYGGTFKIAVYSNANNYKFIVSPPTGGGNRCDIFGAAATWNGTTFTENGAGIYVNYHTDPTVQNWRAYATQSTLLSPQPTGSVSAGDIGDAAWAGGGGGGAVGPSDIIAAMTLVGTNLFVVYEKGYVETLDVTDPSAMAWTGHCDTGYSSELQLSAWVAVKDGFLYANSAYPGLSDQGSILVYDISTPTSVSVVNRIRTPNGGGGGLVIIGNILWVCEYFSTYQTGTAWCYGIDITTPASAGIDYTLDVTESTPNTQHGGTIGRPFEPWGMDKSGNTLYILDDYILQAWDVSSPGSPVKVSVTWNEDNYSDTEGFCVDDVNGFFFFAVSGFNGPANRGGSLVAFDLVSPGNPLFATEIYPLSGGGGASRCGPPDTTRRLVYCCVSGQFSIFSY